MSSSCNDAALLEGLPKLNGLGLLIIDRIPSEDELFV
jgi:hypothetical protein